MRERPLTELEAKILGFIKKNPGLTPYDIAEEFEQSVETYRSIYYLIGSGCANIDLENNAVTYREI
jgi:hypothetical protein